MNSKEEKKAYKEVLTILKELDMLNSIPIELVNKMREIQDEKWYFSFDATKKLEEQDILKSTAIILSALYVTYICEDKNEKEELRMIYENNESN